MALAIESDVDPEENFELQLETCSDREDFESLLEVLLVENLSGKIDTGIRTERAMKLFARCDELDEQNGTNLFEELKSYQTRRALALRIWKPTDTFFKEGKS